MSQYGNYTEAQLIKEALDVQNACNLSGVAQSFAEAICRLWVLAHQNDLQKQTSTAGINQHIVCKLFVSKMLDLAGDVKVWPDYQAVQDRIELETLRAEKIARLEASNEIRTLKEAQE